MDEPTHFADGRKIPKTFCFVFPDEGHVWEKDMTREQLLHVIEYLMDEKDYWAAEAKKPRWWQT